MAGQVRLRVGLAGAVLALAACSSGGSGANTSGATTGVSGTSGSASGVGSSTGSGVGGTGTSDSSASGANATSGAPSSGAAGTGGASSSGSSGSTAGASGSTTSGNDGGGPPDGGMADGATSTGEAGATSCAGRAISLAANGSGTDSDAARARVVIDLMADMPIGNSNRTIEFWAYIKPTDWVAERNEIFLYGMGGTKQVIGLDFGTPGVKTMPGNHATLNPYTNGVFDDDNGVYLGITSTMSQWVHIAMTWDGMALRTYVNGVVRITTMAAGQMLATVAGPFTMGCNPPIFNCFNGIVDELRVWNVARSDTDILGAYDKGLAGNETGLVGYWKFDDAPGSPTAADSVTTAGHTPHPGTLMSATDAGAPVFVTPDPPSPVACP